MSTVVLKAEVDHQLTNVLLDSGAGLSIIDSESLKRLQYCVGSRFYGKIWINDSRFPAQLS